MDNSEGGGGSATPNGVGDPLQRLASFKGPRDLSLGGVKLNKKVFAPNLNVSRNKGKGAPATTREKKEQTNKGKERKNDRPRRNGPNIIQSSGVFSEGVAKSEKYLGITGAGGGARGGHGGGGGGDSGGGSGGSSANVLQKPTIRPNDIIKVDKQLEDECIRRAMGGDLILEDDSKSSTRRDLPVKLPIADFRHLGPVPPVVVKSEPDEHTLLEQDEKPLLADLKSETFEDNDIISLLRLEEPTLILMQLPDCMPGQGGSRDRLTTENNDETDESRCRLSALSEGRVGRLRVHRSGKVRMLIGDTPFQVILGTKAMHHQEVVSVSSDAASRSARLAAVGPLQHKLTVAPDWETLLRTTSA